jgi:hypothetical protein
MPAYSGVPLKLQVIVFNEYNVTTPSSNRFPTVFNLPFFVTLFAVSRPTKRDIR